MRDGETLPFETSSRLRIDAEFFYGFVETENFHSRTTLIFERGIPITERKSEVFEDENFGDRRFIISTRVTQFEKVFFKEKAEKYPLNIVKHRLTLELPIKA